MHHRWTRTAARLACALFALSTATFSLAVLNQAGLGMERFCRAWHQSVIPLTGWTQSLGRIMTDRYHGRLYSAVLVQVWTEGGGVQTGGGAWRGGERGLLFAPPQPLNSCLSR